MQTGCLLQMDTFTKSGDYVRPSRAGFTHRHSRHVPMLARPGGPKHYEEIFFLLYYGLSTRVK